MSSWKVMVLLAICGAIPLLPQAEGWKPTCEKSLVAFVQGFYDWYVPLALKTDATPSEGLALRTRASLFSRELLQALEEDYDAQAKTQGEIVGLDFDPFLASQDPCEHYVVGTIARRGACYRVSIHAVCSGRESREPDVVAELVRRDKTWVFTNFHYPRVGSDLLGVLRNLREERKKAHMGH